MKKLNSMALVVAFVLTITFVGAGIGSNGNLAVNAQDTMMGRMGDTVQKTSKKVYSKSRRVGSTVGSKTWNGTKWVASKSYRGGRWVAVKTVNGTKWVYRKSKNFVTGKKKVTP